MKAMFKRIIPCLDVKNGRVVKGVNFENLRDVGDPAEIASYYEKAGADELTFLDITATTDARNIMTDVVKRVVEQISIPLIVGGGIRTIDDFSSIMKAGASKVSVNTAALKRPELISDAAREFGRQCVIVAIDAKMRDDRSGWDAYMNGGRVNSGRDAVKWAMEAEELGCGEILLTSMDRDGRKDGYDLELTRAVAEKVNVPVIASGGAGTMEHFYDAIVKAKADAVLAASLFHFREVEIMELKRYLSDRGIRVKV